ncbi:hypothetical protein WJX73_007865 [Symbiochloris irregularis]|uniref:Mediator of RNA polymerase II transcription subunit 21 n=1 Tax=Symbiochloris irregularis TaxID=706552 RepID=A0AAW1NM25_9CHLO
MALSQRLERAVKDMVDSFYTIIKSSQVSTGEAENQSQDQNVVELHEVLSSQLLSAAQAALSVIQELRCQDLIRSAEEQQRTVSEREASLMQGVVGVEQELQSVKHEMSATLQEMQRHYYSSAYRAQAPPSFTHPSLRSLYQLSMDASGAG